MSKYRMSDTKVQDIIDGKRNVVSDNRPLAIDLQQTRQDLRQALIYADTKMQNLYPHIYVIRDLLTKYGWREP